MPSAAKTAPTNNPNLRSSRAPVLSSLISWRIISVQFKFLQPIDIFIQRLLFGFFDQEITQQQVIHICAHETEIGLFRRANNRLTTHVERSVNDHRATMLVGKFSDQSVKERLMLFTDCLDTRGIVHMSHRGNRGSHREQLFQSKSLLLFCS